MAFTIHNGITHIETAPLTTTVKRSGTVLPRR